MRAATGAALILSLASPLLAGDFSLGLPVDCTLGHDCFIQQYVDLDPGPGAWDHRCGPLSYDAHSGTDFALPTLRAMARDVAVLAVADGVVRAVREGMDDRLYRPGDDLGGRDCGNGLMIDHADGWSTQYCHLRKDSLTVAAGANVAKGDVLGRIGLSGRTQFAHLHLTLRREGEVVDPFRPSGACATDGGAQLWDEPINYAPGGILDVGFSSRLPEFDLVKGGTAADPQMSVASPALILFALAFGGRIGDMMHMQIDGPAGTVVAETLMLDRTQAQLFRATGRPQPKGGWPPGRYVGQVALLRDGALIDTVSRQITLD